MPKAGAEIRHLGRRVIYRKPREKSNDLSVFAGSIFDIFVIIGPCRLFGNENIVIGLNLGEVILVGGRYKDRLR